MGIFWDLMQESKMDKQQEQANSMEERLDHLEAEIKETKELLKKTLMALETHLDKDIDGDGKKG